MSHRLFRHKTATLDKTVPLAREASRECENTMVLRWAMVVSGITLVIVNIQALLANDTQLSYSPHYRRLLHYHHLADIISIIMGLFFILYALTLFPPGKFCAPIAWRPRTAR